MVPVKVRECDSDLFLLVTNGVEVFAQISQSRARVNNGDLVRIRDLQTGGISAELLEPGIADGDRSPRSVKLKLHRIVFVKAKFSDSEHQAKKMQVFAHSIATRN